MNKESKEQILAEAKDNPTSYPSLVKLFPDIFSIPNGEKRGLRINEYALERSKDGATLALVNHGIYFYNDEKGHCYLTLGGGSKIYGGDWFDKRGKNINGNIYFKED